MAKSKSVIVNNFGGYDCLSVGDFQLPPLVENVEVQVEYAGLNFADIYTRKGLLTNKTLPFVLGIECTGIITAIGENVKNINFKVGQKVICYDYNGGMYGETIRLNPSNCFLLPDFIDTRLGAAIFVSYLTAYISLIHLGNLRENESVLILSCTGGVGSAAVQISKTIHGVRIYGTGSKNKSTHAVENGVHTFFCNDTFLEEVKSYKFDVILSNESGSTFTFLQSLLKPLGRIILIGANNLIENFGKPSVESQNNVEHDNIPLMSLMVNNRVVSALHLGLLLEIDPEKIRNILNHIFTLVQQKKIYPIIHSVWNMSEITDATKLLEKRKNVGKVLLNMSDK